MLTSPKSPITDIRHDLLVKKEKKKKKKENRRKQKQKKIEGAYISNCLTTAGGFAL
jgi:hypothetical protein